MRAARRKLPIIIIVSGIIIAAVGTYVFLPRETVQPQVYHSAPHQTQKVSAGLPLNLKVPIAGIDAKVDLLGVTPAGDMEAPSVISDTGWYKFGPHPGDIGSAVIAGHYGKLMNGTGSVFDNLGTLRKGDAVYVRDDKGATVMFTVQTSKIFGKNDDARTVFTSDDNKAHLNLVTCHGVWQKGDKTYSDRLVVFTDLDTNK